MFSILIPTYNNLDYLKICLESLKKNSKFDHQIIIHINEGSDGTLDFIKNRNIEFTYTKNNIGMPKALNLASKLSKKNYILISHDDFYFCPDWDLILMNEIKSIGHNKFYLSGTMMYNGQIKFDCGNSIENFDEQKFLNNYLNYNYYDFRIFCRISFRTARL